MRVENLPVVALTNRGRVHLGRIDVGIVPAETDGGEPAEAYTWLSDKIEVVNFPDGVIYEIRIEIDPPIIVFAGECRTYAGSTLTVNLGSRHKENPPT